MTFIWPLMLVALVLVPLLIALYIWKQRQRQQLIARNSSLGFVQGGRKVGFSRHLPPLLFMLALTILTLALARPETVITIPRIEGMVILAFDVSGSMAAEDLQPTRMDAAKAAAESFVQRQPPNVKVGVVAFSDSGFSIQTPTNVKEEVLATLNRMTPQAGTSLASGIIASLNTLYMAQNPVPSYYTNLTPEPTVEPTPMPRGQYVPSVIVLLTDGENTSDPDPFEAAQLAADRGVRVYTVGIGSPQGADLEIEGFTVHTQLDEGTLQQLSAMTGGTYFNAQSEEELQEIYDNLSPQLIFKQEKTEVTSLFAGLGIFILLVGGLVSLLWFGRLP
ncbi:MAG: VWA domain-containing protein [Anaerolineae bacterium]|nr:VWA domain-containing protein [Anaerolineae bacterium]